MTGSFAGTPPIPPRPPGYATSALPPPWTARDEQKRRQLQTDLAALDERRRVAVVALQQAAARAGFGAAEAAKMIEFADLLRDALAPFDSGVRPEVHRDA